MSPAQSAIKKAFIAPAPSVCAVRDDVPAYIDALIRRAMAKDAASEALREMLRLKPDYTETGRERLEQWFDAAFVEHVTDGLRKAGLNAPPSASRSA